MMQLQAADLQGYYIIKAADIVEKGRKMQEIEKQIASVSFDINLRGYNLKQVDAFLDKLQGRLALWIASWKN